MLTPQFLQPLAAKLVIDLRDPVSTVTTSGSQQQLIAAHLCTLRRNSVGCDMREPVPTVTAGAEHHALIQCQLSPEQEAGALRCAALRLLPHALPRQRRPVGRPARPDDHHHHARPPSARNGLAQGRALGDRGYHAAHAGAA